MVKRTRWQMVSTAVAGLAAVVMLMAPGAAQLSADGAASQIEAGALASWGDLSSWSRPAAGVEGRTEHGLGLVLSGGSGQMRLAFFVVRADREPARSRPIETVGLRAAAGARVNPNLIRRPTLMLTFGDPGADPETLDLSESMTVDNPAPGAPVASGVGSMAAADFLRMIAAEEISGEIFGASVTFRADQVDAARAFGERFFPGR